ncbi:hypothetical protein GCM10011317_50290 [Niveispirillum cyanobacteriorum]|nr:hypothetical protein GCM10011317_50290 [Niveispirillum cyanobacteriorum]
MAEAGPGHKDCFKMLLIVIPAEAGTQGQQAKTRPPAPFVTAQSSGNWPLGPGFRRDDDGGQLKTAVRIIPQTGPTTKAQSGPQRCPLPAV